MIEDSDQTVVKPKKAPRVRGGGATSQRATQDNSPYALIGDALSKPLTDQNGKREGWKPPVPNWAKVAKAGG